MCNAFTDGDHPSFHLNSACQAILLARLANDPLGILVHVVSFAWLKGILVLRFHISVAYLDRIQFIRPNTPVQQLLPSRFCIECPCIVLFHQRHREWPILITNQKERSVTSSGI